MAIPSGLDRTIGSGFSSEQLYSMKIDGSGNIYVTGSSSAMGSSYDYATIKYLPNGDTAWVRRYDGPANATDIATALTVDQAGNTFVTGTSKSGGHTDYLTIKYNPDGSTGWVKRYYNSLNEVGDTARCIAVDGHEDVFVSGQSVVNDSTSHLLTMRYSYLGPLVVTAYSPVNLKVTDPAGFYIGKNANNVLSQTLFPANYYDNMGPNAIDSVVIYMPIAGPYTIEIIPEAGATPGALYAVGIRIDGSEQSMLAVNATVPPPGNIDTLNYTVEAGGAFLNGDASRNGVVNVLDITFLISYLYKHGPAPDPLAAGDANCNELVNVLDITYLINYLYKGGPIPCSH